MRRRFAVAAVVLAAGLGLAGCAHEPAGGQWNSYDLTLKGTHIVIVLNGVKTAEFDHSLLKDGQIALQYAQGAVKFRNVRIKEL